MAVSRSVIYCVLYMVYVYVYTVEPYCVSQWSRQFICQVPKTVYIADGTLYKHAVQAFMRDAFLYFIAQTETHRHIQTNAGETKSIYNIRRRDDEE